MTPVTVADVEVAVLIAGSPPHANGADALSAAPRNDACACCADCGHWSSSRSSLEADIPGLVSLGSGFGASAADTRLCRVHDRLTSPRDRCQSFVHHPI